MELYVGESRWNTLQLPCSLPRENFVKDLWTEALSCIAVVSVTHRSKQVNV